MEKQAREMMELFSHPGYRRLLEAVERKWVSLDRFAGQVQVPDVTEEESQKISGLLGERFPCGETATIKLSVLEKKLLSSRWAVGLETLVPLVTGRPLVSRKQQEGIKVTAWESFCETIRKDCRRAESRAWWNGIHQGVAPGSRAVRSVFEGDVELAVSLALLCIRALDELPCWQSKKERLPVFATRLFGNPHALDADQPAGRWLYQALCSMFGVAAESAAEWKREVWLKAGVLLDELSSFVTVVGLRTMSGDSWEAFFETAFRARMPLLLPLTFFQEKVVWQQLERVFVVENPAVLHSLLDRWPSRYVLPVMVCTSGQPSVAALRLLDAMVAQGTKIWYNGDFDLKGIEMAFALQKRYGDHFVAWRMGEAEYLTVERGVPFEEEQLAVVQQLEIVWDGGLAAAFAKRREKVFQESLVPLLLKDMMGG